MNFLKKLFGGGSDAAAAESMPAAEPAMETADMTAETPAPEAAMSDMPTEAPAAEMPMEESAADMPAEEMPKTE